MKNNLTTTNQNAKLALSKSKSLLDITNKLLAKKDIGQVIQSFKFKPFVRESGHSSSVISVAISPDGKTIVSGSGDETIKIWDIKSGECNYTIYNIEDGSTITMFSDGYFNSSEEDIDKFIRINDTSTSCRKLTKEEIEHFCKVKYENKSKMPLIDIDEDEIPF